MSYYINVSYFTKHVKLEILKAEKEKMLFENLALCF